LLNNIVKKGEPMMSLRSIRARLAYRLDVDNEVLERSRLARVGNRLIQLALIMRLVEPVLLLVATLILMSASALAQQAGGDIFGQNDQTVGNSFREIIRWGRNLLFLIGVGGVGWGAANIMMEKPYMKQMIGGGASMGFGGIAALVYSFSQGRAVDLDTDLGN
jgi:hypothetical protein